MINELKTHQKRFVLPEKDVGESDPRQRIHRALTYYTNHESHMNSPEDRKQGLPLTSVHIESAIKQINARVKGTEKFWRKDHANAVLQLRADSLSHSQPLKKFWTRWRANQTGADQDRTTVPNANDIPGNAPQEPQPSGSGPVQCSGARSASRFQTTAALWGVCFVSDSLRPGL